MQDRLKEFMNEHRDAFDSEMPPDAIRERLEEQLSRKQPPRIRQLITRYVKIAAAVIILFGVGVLTGKYLNDNSSGISMQTEQEINDLNAFYSKMVNTKMQELKSYSSDTEVLDDLKELEVSFQELKSELGNEVNDQQVLEAMVKEYHAKIEILDRVLQRMHASKKQLKSKKL